MPITDFQDFLQPLLVYLRRATLFDRRKLGYYQMNDRWCDLQKFVSALHGKLAHNEVLFTIGTNTQGAIDYAQSIYSRSDSLVESDGMS